MLGRAGSWIMKRIMISLFWQALLHFCLRLLWWSYCWDANPTFATLLSNSCWRLRERGCFRWADNYRRWWWNLLIKIGAYFFLFLHFILLLLVRKILRCCCLYLYVDNNESRVCSCLNLFFYFGTFFYNCYFKGKSEGIVTFSFKFFFYLRIIFIFRRFMASIFCFFVCFLSTFEGC